MPSISHLSTIIPRTLLRFACLASSTEQYGTNIRVTLLSMSRRVHTNLIGRTTKGYGSNNTIFSSLLYLNGDGGYLLNVPDSRERKPSHIQGSGGSSLYVA